MDRLILHFGVFHHLTFAEGLDVALLDVDDDVEVLVGVVLLPDHRPEDVFEHRHECRTVDILKMTEFAEAFDEVRLGIHYGSGGLTSHSQGRLKRRLNSKV